MNKYYPVDETDLYDLDAPYEEAQAPEGDFEAVPEGKYQVRVERADLTRAKSTGNRMLAWELEILGPAFAGRKLWRNNMMVTAENLKWLKRDLVTCGLKLEKLSDLPSHLGELLDIRLEVTLKYRDEDDYNVYFNKRIGSPVANKTTDAAGPQNEVNSADKGSPEGKDTSGEKSPF